MNIIIYGAQGYALGAYEAIKNLYPARQVLCFMVSSIGNNARTLGNLPVKEIAELSLELSLEERRQYEVLIATPEDVQPDIEDVLENYGFIHHQRLTSSRWEELMGHFHTKRGQFRPLSSLPVGCRMPFFRCYMAQSEKDTPLRNGNIYDNEIIPIQVGAADAFRKVAAVRDDTGDNISAKNGNYSELTALYWIWQNKLCLPDASDGAETEKRQYYGLSQYRRLLLLSRDDCLRLMDNDVDAVLPYPMPYEPNIEEHHRRYLSDADWNALLRALRELQPDYAKDFSDVLEQPYLYNYNIILAKKDVLRDYCAWLFPILFRVEKYSVPKGSERSDRYIGYMAESLETLYFIRNASRLNVTHTGCKLLV